MCAVTEHVDNRPQLRDTPHELYAGDSEHAQLCHGYDTIILRRCALRRSVSHRMPLAVRRFQSIIISPDIL